MVESTQVCWLTAPGRSAVAVVAARGGSPGEVIARLFQPAGARDVRNAEPGAVRFGQWRTTGEELVVCVTSQQWEVHCHGGVAAAATVIRDLVTEGCQLVSPSDWQLAPDETPSTNLALRRLANAATPRVAGMLLDQIRGAWDRADQHLESLWAAGKQHEALEALERWERIASCATVFERPWRVAICGVPNAGKSTFVNALLGYERTVVWDQPGTTRDVVETTTVLDGWPIVLWDTAGIRETEDSLEQEGARRAKEAALRADLQLELVDLANPQPMHWEPQAPSLLRVGNKRDLLEPGQQAAMMHQHSLAMCISATDSGDVQHVARKIVACLAPHVPAPGDPLPVHPMDRQRLHRWRAKMSATG